jgi:hypothetical protein
MRQQRVLAEEEGRLHYFKAVQTPASEPEEGTRDMGELYPFLISGGSNTERYYFTHINDTTEHKFNIRPRFFGDESSYTDSFPKRIQEVLTANRDARIFCVFDWDTVYGNEARFKRHQGFEEKFKEEIAAGIVTLCPSMPSIEYWFLLHFVDYTKFLKNYRAISNVLGPYLRPCFPDSKKPLKSLLKQKKYLEDSTWVKNICADGKLDAAIERAEKIIVAAVAAGELEKHSYSYIYKVFENNK